MQRWRWRQAIMIWGTQLPHHMRAPLPCGSNHTLFQRLCDLPRQPLSASAWLAQQGSVLVLDVDGATHQPVLLHQGKDVLLPLQAVPTFHSCT
jgi:hypothetical protein